jgi:hypothetical protein
MRLMELFDQPQPYAWTTQRPRDRYVAKFDIQGVEYMFAAHWFPYEDEDTGDELVGYEVSFCRQEGGKCRSDKTRTGNEHIIFATVLAIFKELASKIKIDRIAFSAEEANRRSLYQMIMRRILPTWQLAYHEDDVYYYDKPQRRR